MREISLDRLRTLVAIADLGSFARAAQTLHLAPPTVSLHVAELEERLGASLLHRGRGEVRPTAIGDSLIVRARQLLSQAEQALDEVRRQVAGVAGRVRIGASTGVLAHLLPQALHTLSQEHPDIDVQVAVLTSEETLTRLRQGMVDIGLVALPQSPTAGIALHPWRRDPVLGFVPQAWPVPARLTPAWLARRPLIFNDNTTRLARLTLDWFARAGQLPQPRIQLNYNDAIKSLVAAGYGAALLPQEATALPPGPGIRMRPLRPALWRALGIAHRAGPVEPATAHVLEVLRRMPATATAQSR